jgi:adenine-specific DNA-methyltransferase
MQKRSRHSVGFCLFRLSGMSVPLLRISLKFHAVFLWLTTQKQMKNKSELIKKIKDLEGLSLEEKSALIDLLNHNKHYGLVWEDKPEAVEEILIEKLPVLSEVKERAIIFSQENHSKKTLFEPELTETPNHILIEGDNLHALTALAFTHEGKIDVMYFDPPYNTGSKEDFIFNDHYVDSEDAFRHSKWLSFMGKRLKIAKRLLAKDGVVFCSIGDEEIAQLTLLFNEIFGEENKIGSIARVAKTAGDKGSYFAPSKDYVLVYCKNKSIIPDFKDDVDESLFKKVETEGTKKDEKYRDDVAFYQSSLDTRPNQRYFVKCPDGSFVIPPGKTLPTEKNDGAKAIPIQGDGVWRWSVDEGYFRNKHLLVFKQTKKSPLLDENGNQAKWNIYTKSYLNDRSEKGKSPRDYLDQFINRKGADFIKLYDIDFSYSKPLELIQHLIKITNKPNNIKVLDFFAGSGTTLHSTVSLNSNDNGSRQCILVTNNENNICEKITYQRCQRIFTKYINSNGKEMPYFPNNNLRYYKTEFVGREKTLKNKKLLTELATDLLCIKENTYTEINSKELGVKSSEMRVFTGNGNPFMVIYDDIFIPKAVDVINQIVNLKSEIKNLKVYVFAEGQDPYTEDFEEVLHKVELCALPDAIYKAYQNILPKKKMIVKEVLEEAV